MKNMHKVEKLGKNKKIGFAILTAAGLGIVGVIGTKILNREMRNAFEKIELSSEGIEISSEYSKFNK